VRTVRAELPAMGVLVVTHYVKLLEEIAPDQVHVLIDGRVVTSGGPEIAERIEREGYDALRPALT
jgi:Fe-S cluster assembly ATP-binding protein